MTERSAASTHRVALAVAVVGVAAALFVVLYPYWVIRPFRAQDRGALSVALFLARIGPWASVAGLLASVAAGAVVWRTIQRRIGRVLLAGGWLLALLACVFAHVNVFERMFHPIGTPVFVAVSEARLDDDERVLALYSGGVAKAYPVRAIAYHHIVNDVLDGAPIVVTYCSLCHTGIVFGRVVGGRTLTFGIGGINQQNLILRDHETGTYWQQSTGEAISGPLRGERLSRTRVDELSFALWKREAPRGLVLAPVAADAAAYLPSDWEARTARLPSVVDVPPGRLGARDLVVGVAVGDATRAYPLAAVRDASLVSDVVGGEPILIVVGPDDRSIRAFSPRVGGVDTAFVRRAGPTWALADARTGSTWTFAGCASSGGAAGACLPPIATTTQYWFDWYEQHPRTSVYEPPHGGGDRAKADAP